MSNFGNLTDILTLIGAVTASYVTLKLLCSIYRGMKAYMFGHLFSIDLKKTGRWAVVTGSTDGIGKSYAHQLAKRGMDIILISRNPQKLEDVSKEIENQWKVATKCISIDFTAGREIYKKIENELKDMDIGVLVNNVGMSYGHPMYYDEVSEKTVDDLIKVNISSIAEMVRIVLPGLVKKKKGVILNISSASSQFSSGLLTEYAASKAFVNHFSQSLHNEYKSRGIIVQSVLPMFVATNMSKVRKASLFICGPDTYASSALNTVGVESRTLGYWPHALQVYILECIPKCVVDFGAMKVFLGLRSKAIRKQQQKKE